MGWYSDCKIDSEIESERDSESMSDNDSENGSTLPWRGDEEGERKQLIPERVHGVYRLGAGQPLEVIIFTQLAQAATGGPHLAL